MRCSFAAAWDGWQGVLELDLRDGATVADALAAARRGLAVRGAPVLDAPEWQDGATGIFGEVCGRDRVLQPDDRVELYRALKVDPKAARRARAEAVRASRASSSRASATPAAERPRGR